MNQDLDPSFAPTPQPRRSSVLPLILIIGGTLLQLYASGLGGAPDPAFLERAWAIVIVAAGLDFLIVQKRFISGAVLTLLGGIVLVLNFGGGDAGGLREIFNRFWPLLLVAVGIDILLRSRVIGAIVSFVFVGGAILITIFVSNGLLTIPNITLPKSVTINQTPYALPSRASQQTIAYPYPDHNAASLIIHAPSGQIDLRGNALGASALTGSVRLASGETFSESADGSGALMRYELSAEAAETDGTLEFGQEQQTDALWKLEVDQSLPLTLETTMNNGYQLLNLSRVALHSASVTSRRGNIDVLLPYQAQQALRFDCQNGNLRIYVPKGVNAFITLPPEAEAIYPAAYTRNGGQIYPNGEVLNVGDAYQVNVDAAAPNGTIEIKLSEN